VLKQIVKKLFVNPLRRVIRSEVSQTLFYHDMNIPALRHRRALETTVDFVEKNLTSVPAVRSRDALLDLVVDAVPRDATGLYCEFGVFKGETITRMAKRRSERRFYGFDSFEGLPENWKPGCGKGAFDLRGVMPDVPPNVELVKGFFQDSLPGFLQQHPEPAALLHIDCDLYSSTKCVLDLFKDRIVSGTVILFDEYFNYPGWMEGEHRAWCEFVAAGNLAFEYLAYNELNEQLAVRIC